MSDQSTIIYIDPDSLGDIDPLEYERQLYVVLAERWPGRKFLTLFAPGKLRTREESEAEAIRNACEDAFGRCCRQPDPDRICQCGGLLSEASDGAIQCEQCGWIKGEQEATHAD